MEFRGPDAGDFENVHSLNRAFLQLVKHNPDARKCLQGLRPEFAAGLTALSDGAAERLSGTPFLLLSFRERDDELWDAIFADTSRRGLFAVSASDELGRLISAGLGFVWQLARQNPFAARLVCGASLHWCEQLAERTFFQVLVTAGARADILTLRCPTDAGLWAKLLASGVSREKQVRRAAHISALQSVLTRAAMPDRRRWAACARRAPSMKVADDDQS